MSAPAAALEFCLEPLTVMDCTAEEGIEIAAATGCGFASLWVQRPGIDWPIRCIVDTAEAAKRVGRSLVDNGVRPLNLEVFELTPETPVSAYRQSLELGARLGAKGATAIFRADGDPQQRADLFAEFCQLAAEFDLRANVEFVASLGLRTLEQAVDLLRRADQPNAGVVVDILHLVRSGGSVDQVRRMSPGLIGHAQLSDGPATVSPEGRRLEGGSNRMVPGEGDFPIRAFLDALPPMPLGLEVPFRSAAFEGLTPLDRVRRLVQATRGVESAGAI